MSRTSPAESTGVTDPPAHPSDSEVENATSQVEETLSLREQLAKLEDIVAKALEKAPVPAEELGTPCEGVRSFVAPAHPNGKFLVKQGTLIQALSPDGPRDIRRDGDIWAKFSGGVLVTEDLSVIAWCEKHPEICRDAFDPRTDIWVALIEAQRETATRSASLPPGLDVAKLLQGDLSGLGNLSSLAAQARKAARR